MYERHKRRYSLCDISKVDRPVDVVLLKVRGRASYAPSSQALTSLESESWVPGHLHWKKGWEVCGSTAGWGVGLVILGFLKEYLNKNTGTENQHWATYCLNVTLRALKCILMLRRPACSWKSQREKFIFRVALSCDVSVCPSVPVMPTPRPPSVWVSFFDSLALAASVSVLCLSVFCCFCCLFIHNSLGER